MDALTEAEIITINVVIQRRNNQISSIRDPESLDYIIRSAKQEVFGQVLYGSVVELTAFYFIKLTKKHVFNDANKRTAVTAATLFLEKNHCQLPADNDFQLEISNLAIHVAKVDGESDTLKARVEDFFRKHISAKK